MSELNRLRMELKTDIELIAIHQGDMATRVEGISSRLEGQEGQITAISGHVGAMSGQINTIAGQINTIAGQINTIAGQINTIAGQIGLMAKEFAQNSQETARLGREVAEGSRWMQGRLRLLGERFDSVLGAVETDQLHDRSLLHILQAQQQELHERVSRLEQDRSSAA